MTATAGTSPTDVLARFGRALADPVRCRVLLALRRAPGYPAELATELGVSRTRMSNHLACLRECGLVATEPDGRRVRYRLADDRLGHALDAVLAASVTPGDGATCVDAADLGCC